MGVAVTCNVLYVTISQIINVKMYKNLIICNFLYRKKKQNELCEKLRGSRDPKLNQFCSLESYAVTYEPEFRFFISNRSYDFLHFSKACKIAKKNKEKNLQNSYF